MQPNPPPTTTATPPCKNPNPNPHRLMQVALSFLPLLSHISSASSIARRSCRIRRAAYASMAHAAGPGRAWSRALLRRLRRRGAAPLRHGRRVTHRGRTGELRRLVPGGVKMDVCSLLEETGDYIECLQAQVRVMQAVADSFSTNV